MPAAGLPIPIELDQSNGLAKVAEFGMSKSLVYRCPTTGLMVRGVLKEEDVPRNVHQYFRASDRMRRLM